MNELYQVVGVDRVDQADIVVGIPSLNEAENITFVAELAAEGLRRFYPDATSVIINADNHSPDDTRSAFLAARTGSIPRIYMSTPNGITGRGNNLYNLIRKGLELDAKAIVILDADLKSLKPSWIETFIAPILKGYDLVLPSYVRSEYDGTITNHIVYPLLKSLFGLNIRQPIAGDFAFSPTLAREWLRNEWLPSAKHYGIDAWCTMNAVLGGYRIGEAELGVKVHRPTRRRFDAVFTDTVETLFDILAEHTTAWTSAVPEQKIERFGSEPPTIPQVFPVDYKSLRTSALAGYQKNREEIARILNDGTFTDLDNRLVKGRVRIGTDLWARIVFEFLAHYVNRVRSINGSEREQFFGIFRVLHEARTASFIRESLDWDYQKSEQVIRRESDHFTRRTHHLWDLLETETASPADVASSAAATKTP
jgi:glycosyltransferase involved in cell wall biosynthesis